MKIGIIDYGAGNVRSVQFALERLNAKTFLSASPDELNSCDKIIFPGVGHAKPAMEKLKESGLDQFIISTKKPLLGICLGMQLMCKFSEEGSTDCLGIFNATVSLFDAGMGLKIPHMGWNTTQPSQSVLYKGLDVDPYFYFVHSYYVPVMENTNAITSYGLPFSASLERDNFFGVQFHPEKSSGAGERLLQNFIQL